MEPPTPRKSEVASILAQIQAEYESGMQGLTGIASGGARHAFITARMERMGQLHHDLQDLVGEQDAIALLAQTLEQSSGDTSKPQHSLLRTSSLEEHDF